jgi:hypothetical protein
MRLVNMLGTEEGISTGLLHEWLKTMLDRGRFRFNFAAREVLARAAVSALH